MKKVAFINGTLIDPIHRSKETMNLLLGNGKVIGMGYLPEEDEKSSQIIDIKDMLIIPNIFDMYAYFGEAISSGEHENLESLGQTAMKAGVTSIAVMPDVLLPSIDTPERFMAYQVQAREKTAVPIYIIGSITQNREGKLLSEMGLMKEKGALAFSDGKTIEDDSVMKKALQYSHMLDIPLIIGPNSMTGYDMQEGYYSALLGLKGVSPQKEAISVYRDLSFLETYGGRIHFSHITTKESLALIRSAKQKGLAVTCGTAPHYLYFIDSDMDIYDTCMKVNPPFRTKEDGLALIEGLQDGTIDVLASHHRALPIECKRMEFRSAEFGISGLDLFLPLIFTKLYHEKKMNLYDLIDKIAVKPWQILRIKPPSIGFNSSPSFTVLNLNLIKTITSDDICSKGKNTPFLEKELKGFPLYTVLQGICSF